MDTIEELNAWLEKGREKVTIELTRSQWRLIDSALLQYRIELLLSNIDADTRPLRVRLQELEEIVENKLKEEVTEENTIL